MSSLLPTKVKCLCADIAANRIINNLTALDKRKITPNHRSQMVIDKKESMLTHQPQKNNAIDFGSANSEPCTTATTEKCKHNEATEKSGVTKKKREREASSPDLPKGR